MKKKQKKKPAKTFKLGAKVFVVWFDCDANQWVWGERKIERVCHWLNGKVDYHLRSGTYSDAYVPEELYSTKREAVKVTQLKNDMEGIWREEETGK